MNTEELTTTVNALYGLCMAQAGKIAALQTVNEAVIASLGTSMPPLAGQIGQHARGLAPYHRESLEPDSYAAFDALLSSLEENLRALGAT